MLTAEYKKQNLNSLLEKKESEKQIDKNKAEEIRLEYTREICKQSFFDFVQIFWDSIVQEDPVWNWHIEYLCNELQIVAERVIKREQNTYDLIINISPGSTKSTICSVMFPIWLWIRDPSLRIICASYAQTLCLDLAVRSRNLHDSDLFQKLFPMSLQTDMNMKSHFINNSKGERLSVSTGGSVTGMHAHIILVDDPLDPRGANSEAEIMSANTWFDRTLSSRKVDKRVTPTITIMQRLHRDDLTGHLLEKKDVKNIKHICIPCDDSWEIQPPELKKYYKNGLMDEVRLSRKVLEDAKADMGPVEYAGQFGQSPRAQEGLMFPRQNFLLVDRLPAKIVSTIRYWDKAATEGGKGARTAGVKMAKLSNGQYAVLDVKAARLNVANREKLILATAMADGIETKVVIEQEGGSGGKESSDNTIKMLQGFSRCADRPVGEKAFRAEPWSIEVSLRNVLVLRAMWNRDFIDEHCDFPNGLKDQVDAASAAYSWLAGLKQMRKAGAF